MDQVLANEIGIHRFAVRRETHELVFTGVDLESGEVGEGRVQEADRVREMNFLEQRDLVALALHYRGRGPLADAIHGENERILEWRRIERRGGVRQVVLGEQQLSTGVERRVEDFQVVGQFGLL